MESLLSFQNLIDKLERYGISSRTIAPDYRQFDEQTTIQIKKRSGEYALHATEEMYSRIITGFYPVAMIKCIDGRNKSKDEIDNEIRSIKSLSRDILIAIYQGNWTLHPGSAPKYQPHEIIIASNKTLEIVLQIISEYIGNGHVVETKSEERFISDRKLDSKEDELLVKDAKKNLEDKMMAKHWYVSTLEM